MSQRYAAAKIDRLTGDWNPGDPDFNDLIASASPLVRARVRQLVRDFPYFKRAVKCSCDFTVGTGIRLQSKVRNADGELDRRINQEIEEAWHRWQEEADASDKLHFGEMQRLALRQELETGEFLFVKKQIKDPNRFLPFCLMAIEPDRLTDRAELKSKTHEIHQGVEFRKDTCRPVAYWFEDDDTGTKPIRVDARDVVHHFDLLRPGQLRGISPFVSAVLSSNDLGEYIDAELTGSKMASKWVAFIERELTDSLDENGEPIENLENGILERLLPGEKVSLASANRPGNNFVSFVQLLLRMIAVNCDLSYELLSGDYSGISYSNLKGIRNDLTKALRPQQERYINHLCVPVYREFLTQAVLAGRINLPGYFQNPYRYQKASWIPPGSDSLDPLREYKAYATGIAAGLISPQSIILAQGRDPEQVLRERAEYDQMAQEMNITLDYGSKSTALANNPSALGAKE